MSKVALVTGSVRGIGLACARKLASAAISCTSCTALQRLGARSRGRVPRPHPPRRFGARGRLAALISAVIERDGALHHLIHAVGEYVNGSLEAARVDALRHMFASNVETAFLAMQAARERLRASRGDALFFGCAGLAAPRTRRDTALYGAAKSALLVLVRSWAAEEAPHGVRVNMLSPGSIPHAHASADTRDPEHWEKIPLGRPGTPDEIAAAAAWLSSDEASYVTGSNLEATGGWML
jgi:NAD(P)-dependent dehydrogenase (short-subunit alcohol dehydrogenase family)